MPIQKSLMGTPVVPAQLDAPFESHFTRFGLKGIDINNAVDAVEPNELTRMLNVTHRMDSSITSRAGQTNIYGSAVGTNHHSIKRLNSPNDASYTRLIGVDTALYGGVNSLSLIETGFSGEPLSMVQYHPPLSGASWMYIGDTNKMRKVRADGLSLPIGLPAPSTAASTALSAENKTVIASFTSADGTDPSSWTGNPGYTYDSPPVPIGGTEIYAVSEPAVGPGIAFGALYPQLTRSGYYAFYGVPHTVDLSQVGGVPAQDDDYIHLQLNFSHTQFIKEFRIYLVCSQTFSPSVLPGVSGEDGANSDAYVKAFSANDFAAFVQAQLTQFDAAELARIRSLRNQNLTESSPTISDARYDSMLDNPNLNTVVAGGEIARTITAASNAASDQWQPYGVVSIPLRRGDWQRIGTTAGRNWSNITGIVCYIQTGPSGENQVGTVAVRLSELYMTGGSGPDSGEAEDSPYDYRYTHYDPRTGAEGNPSPVQSETAYLDALRRSIVVTPAAYGDSSIRQRIYRRGGSAVSDWFYVGQNDSDGGAFVDEETDGEAIASTSLQIDNYQPVATVNASGDTVLGQPLNSIWGPLQDLIFGCGDPYRPGDVYFCKPGTPDSWPDDYRTEVTAPSEPLLTGCMYNSQSFVFSSERGFILYPNFSGEIPSVSAANTGCTRGPVCRWGLAVGLGGIYFVNNDGIYRTVGGAEEWLSIDIDPIFRNKVKNGYYPVDFSDLTAIRLEIFENELYFQYRDTAGDMQVMIYSIPFQFWRHYQFGADPSCFYADEGNDDSVLLIGGMTTGKTYSYSGTSDDGAAIECSMRTGAIDFGRPRLEKRFGDQTLDYDSPIELTLVNYVDYEAVQNADVLVPASSGRQVAVLDDFGTTPERAKNIATDISWSTTGTSPIIYQLGTTMQAEPDITVNRVTQWDDLGHADASYLMGVTFDCDTGGEDRTIIIEGDYDGAIITVATLTVNASGRRKLKFSWTGTLINKVRVRPNDDCLAWQLFKVDWISQQEPPKISKWDTYFENGWDQYYTGLDLYCHTFGLDKTIEIYVDDVLVKTATVNTNARLVRHITIPWGRGHVFRFVATDDNPGVLYDFRWHLEAEPSEQTNWNQNFTTQAALYDKYLKAVVFECDTFGEDKTVTIECDGVVVETLTINADGRKVVQKAFPQHLGRVFRVYPTDDNPSRLYSVQFVFDGEPFALDRWETQEITHGMSGWSYATYGNITLKSTADVTLSVTAFNQLGVATTKTYVIPSTAGVKVKTFVPFEAMKGILHKYLLTCSVPFTLYQEETTVFIREWGTNQTALMHPFGDSDQDPTRNMFNAALAAARPGGTSN